MHAKSLLDYFSWLFKKYHEIQQQARQVNAFRIIEIYRDTADECVVKIQVAGKSTVFECRPKDIIANDRLLDGFSKIDIRTLTYFATNENSSPKYKILVQDFEDRFNKFKIGKPGSKKAIEKTAEQISTDKSLLRKLDSEDAYIVGYTAAMEAMVREKDEMQELLSRA